MREATAEQRRHPRLPNSLPARIFRRAARDKKKLDFRAHINTVDVSVGGVYLESTFFLKRDAAIEIEITLPGIKQVVHVAGTVVHVIDEHLAAESHKQTGFAIRFDRFFAESEIILRAFLARGDLYGFVDRFAAKYLQRLPKESRKLLVEMIVRWEMLQEALP